MINKITEDKDTKEKIVECVDDKTGEIFVRVLSKGEETISNTKAAFTDKNFDEFRQWMLDKNYMKTDCWCSHIQEFIDKDKPVVDPTPSPEEEPITEPVEEPIG